MLRWSWRDYLMLEEVYDVRVHTEAEFGRRGFSLHYGEDKVLTLLFEDSAIYTAWMLGLEALLKECRRKLGVQHKVRDLLLTCFKAHHEKRGFRKQGHGSLKDDHLLLIQDLMLRLNCQVNREWAMAAYQYMMAEPRAQSNASHMPTTPRHMEGPTVMPPTNVQFRHVLRLYKQ